MLFAGRVDEKVAKLLPLLLKVANINPDRKIQFDYLSFEKEDYVTESDRLRISTFELLDRVVSTKVFIIVPINEYFGRNQFLHATKMIKMNYTMIFTNIFEPGVTTKTLQVLVMNQGDTYKRRYRDDIYFKLDNCNVQFVNPYQQELTEVLDGNWKLAKKYSDMLEDNSRFREDIELLFSTLDVTVIGKYASLQKLTYVLHFTKYADEFFLRETFGDDAMYRAETVAGTWKKLFGIMINPESIAVVYEAELIDIEIIDRMLVQENNDLVSEL